MNNKKIKTAQIKKAFSLVEISIVILIIGLLVAGISKASDMIFDAEVKSLRSLTKGTKVNRLPNLVLWLETTTEESMKTSERNDGGVVTSWVDINPQSPSKIVFKNFKNSTNAKYFESGVGGNNVPLIASSTLVNSEDYFVSTTADSSYSSSAPNNLSTISSFSSTELFPDTNLSIFVVVAPSDSADIFSFCTYTANACDAGKTIKLGSTATRKVQFTMLNGTSTNAAAIETASLPAPVVIISAIRDNTGSKLFVNGGSKVSEASNNTNLTTTSFSGIFRVGPARVQEVIVFSSRLNDSDRYLVESYLGKKYSISVSQTAF